MQKGAPAFSQLSLAKLALHSNEPVVPVFQALALRQLRHSLNRPFASRAPQGMLPVVLRDTRRVLPR
eukprot:8210214-Pyramimonas_sp.AAC.1